MQNEMFTDWNSFGPHREPSSDTLIVLCKKKIFIFWDSFGSHRELSSDCLIVLCKMKYSLTGTVLVLIENHHQTILLSYAKWNIHLLGQFRFSSRTIIRLSYCLMQNEIFTYWDSFVTHREPSSDCLIVLCKMKYSLTVTVSLLIENYHQTVLLSYAKLNIHLLWQFRYSSRTIIRML